MIEHWYVLQADCSKIRDCVEAHKRLIPLSVIKIMGSTCVCLESVSNDYRETALLTQCPHNLFIAALWFQIQHSQHWAQHRHRFLNRDRLSPVYYVKRNKKLLWKARQWSWQHLFRDQLYCQKTELNSFRIQVSSSFLLYFNPVSLTIYKQPPCQAS